MFSSLIWGARTVAAVRSAQVKVRNAVLAAPLWGIIFKSLLSQRSVHCSPGSLVEQGDVFGLRGRRERFQEGVDVGDILVGNDFARVGRHIAGGRVNVAREGVDRQRRRADARRAG